MRRHFSFFSKKEKESPWSNWVRVTFGRLLEADNALYLPCPFSFSFWGAFFFFCSFISFLQFPFISDTGLRMFAINIPHSSRKGRRHYCKRSIAYYASSDSSCQKGDKTHTHCCAAATLSLSSFFFIFLRVHNKSIYQWNAMPSAPY